MYDAPLVALAIGGIELFRRAGLWIERRCQQQGRQFPVWLHWYTWYYGFILGLTLLAIISSIADTLAVTDWLEPTAAERLANQTLTSVDHEGDYVMWKEEASLEGYQALRLLSLSTPFWLLGTFAVSALHTRLHVLKVQASGGLLCSPLRDSTLRILGLPICYGLMSFKSVVRMWQLSVDAISEGSPDDPYFHSYASRRDFVLEMYEANFMVGDIYEAYALAIFGRLLIEVLSRALASSVASITPRSTTQSDLQRMHSSMRSLTIAGIMLFFWVCLLQALYFIFVTSMGFMGVLPQYFSPDKEDHSFFQGEQIKEAARYFFLGAGFVASFAAIGNIMQVETAFHDALKEFHPAPKFWGTKILVTLAFLQSCGQKVIPPFSEWSEVRSNLLYASCLTIECFVISLTHLCAWNHDEQWYVEIEVDDQLQMGEHSVMDDPAGAGVVLELAELDPRADETAAAQELALDVKTADEPLVSAEEEYDAGKESPSGYAKVNMDSVGVDGSPAED